MFRGVQIFIMLLLAGFCMHAQVNLIESRFAFDPQINYDPQIIAPKTFLGYKLGERFTVYEKVVQYFKLLDSGSEKINLQTYGQTYEGRELLVAVISSEENLNHLEKIRTEHMKLTDPRKISGEEAQKLIQTLPVFTSFSYNIHGNEASSTEAVMQVAYRLVAGMDDETRFILNHSVIVLYICINPDGRDRYVYWYNSVVRNTLSTHQRDIEHYEPWPGGRTNHYWFDLNRDWIWRVHPESKGHTDEYQKWLPNLHVDYHEQGYNNNYFTVPGTTPRNLLIPDKHFALQDTIGRANISAFDKHKISYFTREAFDFFYPGYGSSYPAGFGAIAMLVEQGGIGAGLAIETEDGSVLKLRQRIFDHYLTSMATSKKAAEQKALFRSYSFESLKSSSSLSKTKFYILPDDGSMYLPEVLQMLLDHKVEIHKATSDFQLTNVKDYRSGKNVNQKFEKGTFLISTDQPRHLFINSIFDRNMEIEDSVMYDMATWSIPLAYNLEAFSSEQTIKVGQEEVLTIAKPEGKVQNAKDAYAYVIDWNQRHAPAALAMLWEKGYRVRSAVEPITDGKVTYSPGSLIILAGRNLEKTTIEQDMNAISISTGVQIDGHKTGRMLEGYDLASSKNRPVKSPKVAMLIEGPFSSYTCGQIYYLFDQEVKLPIERIPVTALEETAIPKFGQRYGLATLKDYDVLILAGGGSGLKSVFQKEQLDKIKDWINAGGVLIATESAAGFFTREKSRFNNIQLSEPPKDTSEATRIKYSDLIDYNGKKRIPGSALNANLDISNPLAFGASKEVYSIKFDTDALKPSSDLQSVGYYVQDAAQLLASGYASESNLKHLAGKTFAGVVPMQKGKIVYLVDNTQYRMFWRGPSRMMINAVMLLPGF